jgi:hypothetical protein
MHHHNSQTTLQCGPAIVRFVISTSAKRHANRSRLVRLGPNRMLERIHLPCILNENAVYQRQAGVRTQGVTRPGLAVSRVELQLRLDGRLLVDLDGRTLIAVAAPPASGKLRDIRALAASGPKPVAGPDRPGRAPARDHAWNRPGPEAPSRLP